MGIEDLALPFPHIIEDVFREGYMSCCEFNPFGTIMAAGTYYGRIILWDVSVQGVLDEWQDMNKDERIFQICWSSLGDNVAFISNSNICVRRNISGSKRDILKIPYSKDINDVLCHWTRVNFHPTNPSLILASRVHENPLLIDLNNLSTITPILLQESHKDSKKRMDKMAIFSCNSERLFVIDSSNSILYTIQYAISGDIIQIISKYDINANFNIRDMRLSCAGNYLVCNCSDRTIRGFSINNDTGAIIQMFKFQDSVTKMPWNRVRVHSCGEFVIAASGGKDVHQLYIWQSTGALLKILEGPKESLIDFDCQPNHARIVSINHLGDAYIWSQSKRVGTTPFSSEFEEIDGNVYYDEREDEFDTVIGNNSEEESLEQIDVFSFPSDKHGARTSANETPMVYYPIPTLHSNDIT